MDVDRFDALSRSLSTTPSRRGALRLLTGSIFGGLITLGSRDIEAHNAKSACKKKSGKAKKKCLKKAKKHAASHTTVTSTCTPNCGGKTCGDDGCGGSCGPCTGGSCSGGACVCTNGLVACGSRCAMGNGSLVSCPPNGVTTACCSGTCRELFNGPQVCQGRAVGDACEVPAQCNSNVCTGGVCRCPSGQMRKPGTTECCVPNGATCGPNLPACCAGTSQCTGPNSTCVALASGAKCTFDAQCDSGICEPDCSTAPFCTIQEYCA